MILFQILEKKKEKICSNFPILGDCNVSVLIVWEKWCLLALASLGINSPLKAMTHWSFESSDRHGFTAAE